MTCFAVTTRFRRIPSLCFLSIFCWGATALSAANTSWQQARIVELRTVTNDRTTTSVVNTPIVDEEKICEITIHFGTRIIRATYVLGKTQATPPAEWIKHAPVRAQLVGDKLFLKALTGEQYRLRVESNKPGPATDPWTADELEAERNASAREKEQTKSVVGLGESQRSAKPAPVVAQQPTVESSSVSGTLQKMQSADRTEREKGFDKASEMLSAGKTDASDAECLRLGVINLLIAENTRNNIPDDERRKLAATATSCGNGTDKCEGDEGEEESNYYSDLVATVARFHDERAIPALVGAMPLSDATEALRKFGDKAVGPVLEQLKSRNSSLRSSALNMAIDMEGLNESVSTASVGEMLRSALNDREASVRQNAVQAIACRDDRNDFIPTLQNLAKTDPVHFKGRADDGVDGDQFYPVRFEARRTLRAIQNNEPCVWKR